MQPCTRQSFIVSTFLLTLNFVILYLNVLHRQRIAEPHLLSSKQSDKLHTSYYLQRNQAVLSDSHGWKILNYYTQLSSLLKKASEKFSHAEKIPSVCDVRTRLSILAEENTSYVLDLLISSQSWPSTQSFSRSLLKQFQDVENL